MRFTYEGYRNLLRMLKEYNYRICNYNNYNSYDKAVILRHDIDTSVEKAVEMARIEQEEGVFATYFVLVSTDFYNINSKKTANALKRLHELGGEIGLHFDETKYLIRDREEMIAAVEKEKVILELSLDMPIETVSMHRPSIWTLSNSIEIPGMINSYGEEFFQEFKYVSDSRMNWREDVEQLIMSGEYARLHILTHSFWYHEEEKTATDILYQFVKNAQNERYASLSENIRDISEFLRAEDIG